MTFEQTALLLAWGVIVLLAFAMSALLRQMRMLSALVQGSPVPFGLSIGSAVPHVAGWPKDWQKTTLLTFLDRECPNCDRLIHRLSELAEVYEDSLKLVAVYRQRGNGFASNRIEVWESQGAAFAQFRIPLTPFGVVVSSDGKVMDSRPLGSLEHLERVVETVSGKEVRGDGPSSE